MIRSLGRSGSKVKSDRSGKGTPRGGANLLFTVIAVVGCVHALAMLTLEISRSVYTNREVARLERDIAALELESTNLENVVAHKNDASYREQLARLQGFIYANEARYVTVSETPTPAVDPEETSPNTTD